MARRWVEFDEQRALLEEACDVVTLSMYAAMLAPDLDEMATGSYGRLLDLVDELGFPPPPPLAVMGMSGAYTPLDDWLEASGLHHSARRWCDARDGGHWAYQCGQ